MSILADRDLVAWAVNHGWKYFHSNDQLMDPKGGMTTANNWSDIGHHRREQIAKQMQEHARRDAASPCPTERK